MVPAFLIVLAWYFIVGMFSMFVLLTYGKVEPIGLIDIAVLLGLIIYAVVFREKAIHFVTVILFYIALVECWGRAKGMYIVWNKNYRKTNFSRFTLGVYFVGYSISCICFIIICLDLTIKLLNQG